MESFCNISDNATDIEKENHGIKNITSSAKSFQIYILLSDDSDSDLVMSSPFKY